MKCSDFVINKGRFIGKFDEMYSIYKDPWKLIASNKKGYEIDYHLIFKFSEEIKKKFKRKKIKVLEVGCGYPQITEELRKRGFDAYALDISKIVIKKAKKKYPKLKNKIFHADFLDEKILMKIKPDIYIMSDISWYVLPRIKKFIKKIKKIKKNSFLIHFLTMYDKKEQKFGKNYFYDSKGVKKFFNLKYIYSGDLEFKKKKEKKRKVSFFVAKLTN